MVVCAKVVKVKEKAKAKANTKHVVVRVKRVTKNNGHH